MHIYFNYFIWNFDYFMHKSLKNQQRSLCGRTTYCYIETACKNSVLLSDDTFNGSIQTHICMCFLYRKNAETQVDGYEYFICLNKYVNELLFYLYKLLCVCIEHSYIININRFII